MFVETVIVGAGFSGLAMAMSLQDAGMGDFVILERASQIGGTWRDNTYPGCACDVPSHMYSFSFLPNPQWSRAYSPQEEILAYMKECVQARNLTPHIRFNASLKQARYQGETGTWALTLEDGDRLDCRFLVLGIGGLRIPSFPDIKGHDTFEGQSWHSSQWNHEFDLEGKRVAVIGTGASSIQFAPEIAGKTKQLDIYQRTPPWVISKPDRVYNRTEKLAFTQIPGTRRLYRMMIYALMELRGAAFVTNPKIMKIAELSARRTIKETFPNDEEMRQKVTPDYTMGCKRVLFSDDWYPTLAREDVELLNEKITRFTQNGIETAEGTHREYDAIIYGTGFDITGFLREVEIIGRNQEELNELWQNKGIEAWYGVSVHGFPNLFMLVGPNTALGHNSIIFMIECQAHLIRQMMQETIAKNADAIEVKDSVQKRFNRSLQERLKDTVWHSGCQSWYLSSDGGNATLWPGYTWQYWLETRKLSTNAVRLLWTANSSIAQANS